MLGTLLLNKVTCHDAINGMAQLPEGSVDLTMFSPPYYGLRNYGETTEKDWGDWKGQLGLEPTWSMYIDHMNIVCEAVKHVLKKSGSMYIVLGDTYAGSGCGSHDYRDETSTSIMCKRRDIYQNKTTPQQHNVDYTAKCLMGVPWRLAFKLIEGGWMLRNDIIWHKPNSMPSSVKDRLSQTYEHIFHFVRSQKYYYDLDAIRIPHTTEFQPFNVRVRDVKSGKGVLLTCWVLRLAVNCRVMASSDGMLF